MHFFFFLCFVLDSEGGLYYINDSLMLNLVHYEFKKEAMKKSDLTEALSKDTGLPIRKAEEVVKMLFNSMANALADGDKVEIRGFGSFKIKNYDEYTSKKPKTEEPIKVEPRKLPSFKSGEELKERIDTHK